MSSSPQVPPVAIVGGGPGDPELLTIKALRLLHEADVVVYDRLVSQGVLDLVPAGTMRIYVGKSAGHHPTPQDEIGAIMVRLAHAGHRVVRLKGGDPLIFGRGGEEIDHLVAHRIPFEVVPGVTAAAGCAASVGIPITHRQLARGFHIATGHMAENDELDLNWAALADPQTTVVIYMGLASLPELAGRLMDSGRAPDTPAALIAHGTLPDERAVWCRLDEVADVAAATALTSPVLVMIGAVVGLAARWGRIACAGREAVAADGD